MKQLFIQSKLLHVNLFVMQNFFKKNVFGTFKVLLTLCPYIDSVAAGNYEVCDTIICGKWCILPTVHYLAAIIESQKFWYYTNHSPKENNLIWTVGKIETTNFYVPNPSWFPISLFIPKQLSSNILIIENQGINWNYEL